MMGRQVDQGALFYEVRLEDRVPAEHLLRRIDAVLDLSFVYEVMTPYYARGGRPSVDPELLLRMLLVGYLYGVRSERRLCEEVDLNLAFRWFCRLGLDGRVPDHSTFTKNRHGRFRASGLMRELFERVVEQCFAIGLADTAVVAVDGTHVTANARKDRTVSSDADLPRDGKDATRAVRDYLADLDGAAPDLPGTVRQTPTAISLTDPSSAVSTKHGKRVFAYGLNAMIDTASGVVLDIEAAPARTADEPEAARRMVERLRRRHGRTPEILTADAAYGAGNFLTWAESHDIEPHIPMAEKDGEEGRFAKKDFVYDDTRDLYVCPDGKLLERSKKMKGTGPEAWSNGLGMSYSAKVRDCRPCEMKPRCCPKTQVRRLRRSIFEPARDRARLRAETPAFARCAKLRMRVERLFACIKHNDGLTRVRLRGRRGAGEQFTLAAIVQNLKIMAKGMIGTSATA
ncbi:MAG: IS1182 family transposase [Litorimonas sp.]